MGIVGWIQLHWLDSLQSIGIICGLLFTAVSVRQETKTQRVGNLLNFTKQHREIWSRLYDKPELARILNSNVDLRKAPVTTDEELFVGFVILHLSGFHEALKQGLLLSPDGLQKDIREFFLRPIPNTVWNRMKTFQDRDFIGFVDSCLLDSNSSR